jgi:hypothetical protein
MESIVIQQPDPEEHERHGSVLVTEANGVVIANNDDRELAGAFVNNIDETLKRILKEFDGTQENPGPVTLAHRAWKSGVALRERAIASFVMAKGIINGKVRKYEYDVEKKRLEEANRLQKKAQEEAEERRKQQIAEAKRLGDREAVENLKAAPISVVAPPPKTPEVNKVAGMRRTAPMWDFEITDEAKIPRRFLVVDESAIRALVKRLGAQHGIPGITVFDSRSRGA